MPWLLTVPTYLATPHRGSSYMSAPDFARSIKQLLELRQVLPATLMEELRVDHASLQTLDDNFKDLGSDISIWSFYETQDSQLAGLGQSGPTDFRFTAPLTAIKSAILGLRSEKVLALQSSHSLIASFGRANIKTLDMYLKDLGAAIKKAQKYSSVTHVALHLKKKVQIEIHGFFAQDTNSDHDDVSVRAWSARESLENFLNTGPDECLSRRLTETSNDPQEHQFLGKSNRATSLYATQVSLPGTPNNVPIIFGALRRSLESSTQGSPGAPGSQSSQAPRRESTSAPRILLPDQVVAKTASPSSQPMGTDASTSSVPGQELSTVPGAASRRELYSTQAATTWATHTMSGHSLGGRRSPSPSRSALADRSAPRIVNRPPAARRPSDISLSRASLDRIEENDAGTTVDYARTEPSELELPMKFSKPNAKERKFIWIHVPFTNPTWVTVSPGH